jgi:hypothetical protein
LLVSTVKRKKRGRVSLGVLLAVRASGFYLLSSHDRYTRTGACVRWDMTVTYSRYEFVDVLLLKRAVRYEYDTQRLFYFLSGGYGWVGLIF